jgi:hypothetical protein
MKSSAELLADIEKQRSALAAAQGEIENLRSRRRKVVAGGDVDEVHNIDAALPRGREN